MRRKHDVVDEVNRVGDPRVFGNRLVFVVRNACGVQHYVFEKRSRANRAKDVWFFLFGEVDYLSVAAAFKVEYASLRCPAVLIVTDKLAVGVCAQRGFAGARKTKEEGRSSVSAKIG